MSLRRSNAGCLAQTCSQRVLYGEGVSLVADSAVITSATRNADRTAIAFTDSGVSASGSAVTFDPGTAFLFLESGKSATALIEDTVIDDQGATAVGVLTIVVYGLRPSSADSVGIFNS